MVNTESRSENWPSNKSDLRPHHVRLASSRPSHAIRKSIDLNSGPRTTTAARLRCSWSNACRRRPNYVILSLTPGFYGLGKDNCKTRRETLKLCDLVRLILDIWRYNISRDSAMASHTHVLWSPCYQQLWYRLCGINVFQSSVGNHLLPKSYP